MNPAYSGHFYRSVFEHSMEAVFLTSPEGDIHAANPAACALFGHSEDKLCQLGRQGIVDSRSPALPAFLAERAKHGRARAELRFIRADGSHFPGEVSSAQFEDENGEVRTIIIVRDLTELKRSQASLAASEAKYRSVVNTMAEGLVFQDATGQIIELNPAAQRIEGRSAEQMIGVTSEHPQWGAVHEDGSPFPGDTHPAMVTLRTGKPQHDIVMGICRPDGERRWISINSEPLIPPGATAPSAVVTTFHDITARRQAEQQVASHTRQLERSIEQTLQAMATMVEMRDPYTAGHERRVAAIAAAIAREMGWPAERCQQVHMAGLIHDIGKIAVPAEILAKPGKLNRLEYSIVQTHAERGHAILNAIEFPFPLADIVHAHHERLDGSGYPQGLRGDAILPEARILAIADVVESMTSHRPYRAAQTLQEALCEMEAHRGTLYDAEAVDALLRLYRERGEPMPG